jgi:hypothetical protein
MARSLVPLVRAVAAILGGCLLLVAGATTAGERGDVWSFVVLDEAGAPTAARITVYSPEEKKYLVPEGVVHWALQNQPGRYAGASYFYADGAFRVRTQARSLAVYARKGLECEILERTVTERGEPTELRLTRALDMRKRGWFSGDGHVHPVSGTPEWARMPQGPSFHDEGAITDELLRRIVLGEDLAVASLLASNSEGDEVHFGKRVTGKDEPGADGRHLLRVSEEYRSEVFGHMAVFGVAKLSDPVFTALPGSELHPFDYPTNHAACLEYREQGAFPSFAHLRRQKNIALECPVDVALGSLRAVEIQGYAVAPRNAASIWEMLMSCGFDVVITAGTDSTLTFVKNLPPGGARVYVDMEGSPFSHDAWVGQLARGKAFTTNGAMLFLTIDGKAPGDTLEVEAGKARKARVELVVESLFPWETVTLRMNGTDGLEFRSAAGNPRLQRFEGEVTLSGSGWAYAHLAGELSDHVLGGVNPWWTPTHDAFTNAIWIRAGDAPRRDSQSCDYFIDWIRDNLAALEQRNNYGSVSNRLEVRETLERALAIFEQRRTESGSGD